MEDGEILIPSSPRPGASSRCAPLLNRLLKSCPRFSVSMSRTPLPSDWSAPAYTELVRGRRGAGFLLTPDQGPVFADTVRDDLDAWWRLVATCARLQHGIAGSVDRLIVAGMAAMPAGDAPAYVEEQIDALASLPDGHPSQLQGEQSRPGRAPARRTALGRGSLPSACRSGCATTTCTSTTPSTSTASSASATSATRSSASIWPSCSSRPEVRLRVRRRRPQPGKVANGFLEVCSDSAPAAELRAALQAALPLARLGQLAS